MNKLISSLSAAVLACGLASTANAAVTYSLSAAGETTSTVAGVTTNDFNSGVGYASASGDYEIVSGSSTNMYAQPAGTDAPYLTVPYDNSSGSAMFELGTTSDYFGLYWGSMDSYNSISFYLNDVLVGTFTGSDVAEPVADGDQSSLGTNRYVNFMFSGGDMFDAVSFTSTEYAFESDNHAYTTAVPEPQTLAMMLLGILGLGMARRRQRQL